MGMIDDGVWSTGYILFINWYKRRCCLFSALTPPKNGYKFPTGVAIDPKF